MRLSMEAEDMEQDTFSIVTSTKTPDKCLHC